MTMGSQVLEVIRRTLSRNSLYVQCRLQFQLSKTGNAASTLNPMIRITQLGCI